MNIHDKNDSPGVQDPENAALEAKRAIAEKRSALRARYQAEDNVFAEIDRKWDLVLAAFKKEDKPGGPPFDELQDLLEWIICTHFGHPTFKGPIRELVRKYWAKNPEIKDFGSTLSALKKAGKIVSVTFKLKGAKSWNNNWSWWMPAKCVEGGQVKPEYRQYLEAKDFDYNACDIDVKTT